MVVRGEGAFDAEAAAATLALRLPLSPEALLVLGSGLSSVAEAVEDAVDVPFEELPGYPRPGVGGHAGRYVAGRLAGRAVLVQSGRFHFYEGHPMEVVCGPVRVAHRLGIPTLVVTNAAGGVRDGLEPGTLMLIEDHLNLMGVSPLAGPPREGETRFPDLTGAYDPRLRRLAVAAAEALGIPLARGVYAAVAGPAYETPAEVRALRRWGADAVGMSTVPEVVTARALGLSCLAVSLITNRAAGLGLGPLSHEEVVEVGREGAATLARLLVRVVGDLAG